MEHCIASFRNEEKKRLEELKYQVYITDALNAIAENTAKISQGKSLTKRFIDMLQLSQAKPKTREEIVNNIRKKFRGQ